MTEQILLSPYPIYAAFCAPCDKRYYGESSINIQNRFQTGHWHDIRKLVENINFNPNSALAAHEKTYPSHRINPNIICLEAEPNINKRLIKEAIYGRLLPENLSINYDWTLANHDDQELSLRRQGKLIHIPPQWLTLLRNLNVNKRLLKRTPEPALEKELQKRMCVSRTDYSTTTQQNKDLILRPLTLCTDPEHTHRTPARTSLRITQELFCECKYYRCRAVNFAFTKTKAMVHTTRTKTSLPTISKHCMTTPFTRTMQRP